MKNIIPIRRIKTKLSFVPFKIECMMTCEKNSIVNIALFFIVKRLLLKFLPEIVKLLSKWDRELAEDSRRQYPLHQSILIEPKIKKVFVNRYVNVKVSFYGYIIVKSRP